MRIRVHTWRAVWLNWGRVFALEIGPHWWAIEIGGGKARAKDVYYERLY